MTYELKLIYFYQHMETGRVCQRTFSIMDIKDGVDDAHLKLLPGHQLIEIKSVQDKALREAVSDARNGIKVAIGDHTGQPWPEVRDEDVDSYNRVAKNTPMFVQERSRNNERN